MKRSILLSTLLSFALLSCSADFSFANGVPRAASFHAGAHITAANSEDFNFGIEDFSLSAWFRLDPNGTADRTILSKNLAGQYGGGYPGYRLSYDYGRLTFRLFDGSSSALLRDTKALAADQWYHVVAIRRGTNIELYLDGALVADEKDAVADDFNVDNTSPLAIGIAKYWGTSRGFQGDIDDVAVWGEALSVEEVSQLSSYGPDLQNNALLAYFDFQNEAVVDDITGNGHDGTVFGSLGGAYGVERANNGLAVDGSGYLYDAARTPAFNFGTEDFSLSAWFRLDPNGTADRTILSKNLAGQYGGAYPGYRLSYDYGRLSFRLFDGSDAALLRDTKALTTNRWYHVVAIRRGANMELYLDGDIVGEKQNELADDFSVDNSSPFAIGIAKYWGTSRGFDGDINEVSVWNRALSPGEVRSLRHFSPLDFKTDGLTAFYPLDFATTDDVSGNDANLTKSGQTFSSVGEGVTYLGHSIMKGIVDRVPDLVVYELDRNSAAAVESVPAAYSITPENLRDVIIDDDEAALGSTLVNEDELAVPRGSEAFIASGIRPFRFKYFSNEMRQAGGRDTSALYDYCIGHGFDMVNGTASRWSQLPADTTFGSARGIHADHLLDISLANQDYSGFEDLFGLNEDDLDEFRMTIDIPDPNGRQRIFIDQERPTLLPTTVSPSEAAGFAQFHVELLDAAKALGWESVGLYGWQPFSRTWFGLDNYSASEANSNTRWEQYGREIAAESDVVYPSVYNFYWDPSNVPYVLANIDGNVEQLKDMPASLRPKVRPFFWNLHHGGGGGAQRWWRNLPLFGPDLRAQTMMNFFSETDGLVLWGWYARSYPGFATAQHESVTNNDMVFFPGRFLMVKDAWNVDGTVEVEQSDKVTELSEYDLVYVLGTTADGNVRFQHLPRTNSAVGHVDAEWEAILNGDGNPTSSFTLVNADDGDYQHTVYSVPDQDFRDHVGIPAANISYVVEGMAMAKVLEYPLSQGELVMDRPAHESFGPALQVGRRVRFGPYHLFTGYHNVDYSTGSSATVSSYEFTDFLGNDTVDLSFPVDTEARVYLVVESD